VTLKEENPSEQDTTATIQVPRPKVDTGVVVLGS